MVHVQPLVQGWKDIKGKDKDGKRNKAKKREDNGMEGKGPDREYFGLYAFLEICKNLSLLKATSNSIDQKKIQPTTNYDL